MPTVILKLFAGQGTGRTERRLYASPFKEHKKLSLDDCLLFMTWCYTLPLWPLTAW